ncbi:hypothetical protein PV646_28740 [Streptomyces sp. ID05-26A]|nr:hypothetical protein [Streptomyces sp. ID05-26A]
MDITWPDNIFPALRKQAGAVAASAMLDLHPRIVEGLHELAATDERGRRMVELCETWSTGPGALVPAGEVLEIVGER